MILKSIVDWAKGNKALRWIASGLVWFVLALAAYFWLRDRNAETTGQSPEKQAEELQETHAIGVDERRESTEALKETLKSVDSLRGQDLSDDLNRKHGRGNHDAD